MDRKSSNWRRVRIAVLLAGIELATVAAGHAAGLRLGSARVDITPPTGFPLEGYEARKQGSTGVHDSLYARVVVVKSAETSIAFVACDLVAFVSEPVVKGAREKFGIEHVLVSSSHTHGGPKTTIWDSYDVVGPDRSWPTPENSWYAATEAKILRAIGEASQKLEPVTLVPTLGFVYIGYNRRLVDDEGRVKMLWENPQRRPTHPIDPRISLLIFKDERGDVRAVIVNYACHAVVLGPDNLQISADYPGVMCNYVERQLGTNAICLFVQGASGDINPYDAARPVDKGGFEAVQTTGLAIGEKVVEAVKKASKAKSVQGKIQVVHDVLEFAHRWKPGRKVRVGMDTILFASNLAIVTIPGEPFVDFQLDLAAKSEVEYTFLFGYTYTGDGQWADYLPTIEAAAEGGYGAGYNTFIGLGGGEAIVDRAVINLYQMTGHDFRKMLDVLVEEVEKSH
jgi:neutral ceramidase